MIISRGIKFLSQNYEKYITTNIHISRFFLLWKRTCSASDTSGRLLSFFFFSLFHKSHKTNSGWYLQLWLWPTLCALLFPYPVLSHKCLKAINNFTIHRTVFQCRWQKKDWIISFWRYNRKRSSLWTEESFRKSRPRYQRPRYLSFGCYIDAIWKLDGNSLDAI